MSYNEYMIKWVLPLAVLSNFRTGKRIFQVVGTVSEKIWRHKKQVILWIWIILYRERLRSRVWISEWRGRGEQWSTRDDCSMQYSSLDSLPLPTCQAVIFLIFLHVLRKTFQSCFLVPYLISRSGCYWGIVQTVPWPMTS